MADDTWGDHLILNVLLHRDRLTAILSTIREFIVLFSFSPFFFSFLSYFYSIVPVLLRSSRDRKILSYRTVTAFVKVTLVEPAGHRPMVA